MNKRKTQRKDSKPARKRLTPEQAKEKGYSREYIRQCRRVAQGLCVRCSNVLDCDSGWHCINCLEEIREYTRERFGYQGTDRGRPAYT
jgi:hypothetical protein